MSESGIFEVQSERFRRAYEVAMVRELERVSSDDTIAPSLLDAMHARSMAYARQASAILDECA